MDFSVISSKEFEELCCDILSFYMSDECRTFKEGADKGLDIAFVNKHCFIMGQCKRYNNSSYSHLLKSLKEEVPKVQANMPTKYFVFTSMELGSEQVLEIYNLFTPYMQDTSCVFDKRQIEKLLSKEECTYIKRKHIKLWIDSFNTLSEVLKPDLSFDVDKLMKDIDDHRRVYTETKICNDAKKALQENRMILVTGGPGVGKSTLCEMVLLNFLAANDGARVIYSCATDYDKLLANIDKSFRENEIIYIDDFLGQSCLELASSKIKTIQNLLSYVSCHKNLYLIINSRTHVLNEAKRKTFDFTSKYGELININVDLVDFSKLEKAEILYNHIVASELDDDRIQNLLKDKEYIKIIEHKNYIPRLIEHMTNKMLYPKEPREYITYIHSLLAHPERIWEDEYNQMIYPEDRMLIETLYTLSDYEVDERLLEVAFNNQKGNPNYPAVDWSKSNLFENSRTRLYGGFIDSLTTCDGVKKIVVSNPSVNDFLRKEFTNKSSNQKENIANQAVCVDQLMRIYGPNFYDDDFIKHLSDNHFLEKAIVFNPHNYYKAVFYMACLRINDTDQFNTLLLDGINYFVSSTAMIIDYGSFNSLNNIITKMITNETLKYYSFLLQENNLKQVIKLIKYKCTYYEYMSLYNELTILDDSQREEILYFALEDAVNDAISEMDRNALIDNTDVEENTEYYDADGGDIYIDENALAALVDERAEEAFLYSIDNNDEICEIRKLYNYTDDEILECFRGLFSSSDVVEEFLYADKGYDDYDRYKEYEIDVSGSNNNQRIDEMFQGLLDGVDKK